MPQGHTAQSQHIFLEASPVVLCWDSLSDIWCPVQGFLNNWWLFKLKMQIIASFMAFSVFQVFHNCSCVGVSGHGNFSAVLGQCPRNKCSQVFPYFLAFLSLCVLLLSLGGTPMYMTMFRYRKCVFFFCRFPSNIKLVAPKSAKKCHSFPAFQGLTWQNASEHSRPGTSIANYKCLTHSDCAHSEQGTAHPYVSICRSWLS